MSYLKLKQSLKKKSRILTFLIISSLLISETALAVYDKDCCNARRWPYSGKRNDIHIYFKFYEYERTYSVNNSYLKEFEILYSTDGGVNYIHLMSASTQNQTSKTWAWIDLKDKKNKEKIKVSMIPRGQTLSKASFMWKDNTKRRGEGAVITATSIVYCELHWFPRYDVTDIQIKAIWHNYLITNTENVLLFYKLTPTMQKLKSNNMNFSNYYHKQEISTEAKNITVKAYKETNAIVIKGGFNEMIQIYNTTGALVKSMLANRDVLQIPLPANQLYIVNLAQGSYKVAL